MRLGNKFHSAADDATWEKTQEMGRNLQNLMTGTGSQTTWATSDLDKWGWTVVDATHEPDEELDFSEVGHVPLKPILEQLEVSTVISGEDNGPDFRIAMNHNKEVVVNGTKHPASLCCLPEPPN